MNRYTRRGMTLVLGLTIALLGVSGAPVRVHAGVDTVTLSGPGTYGEDDDYFTTVWGNPRDMEDPEDLYLLNSTCGPVQRARWSSSTFSNGVWRGVTSNVGESRFVYLLNPGWISSLDVGEDGELRPIDSSRYRQFTMRMRIDSGAGSSDLRLEWANGPIGASVFRGRKNFQAQSDGKWHIYTFDLGTIGAWTSAPVPSLWIQFEALNAGYGVEIDWVRLTPPQSRRVSWTGSSLSGRAANVYVMPGPSFSTGYGDVLVFQGSTPARIDAGSQALDVPASFPGGTYRARVVAGPSGFTSTQSWTWVQTPIAHILAPSYTSGQDFSTTVLGDPWDMNALGDIDTGNTEMDGIKSLRAAGGVVTIVTRDDGMGSCAAPWPHRPLALNLGGRRIDTTRYRYLTWRYKVDNAPDQGAGGVIRARWQAQHLPYWPTGRTDDISLYTSDWQTYSVDLPEVRLEVEGGTWGDFEVNVMQIMLHESHREWTSHLDWVKLTAENVAGSSYTVQWEVVSGGQPVTTTLYWAVKNGASYQPVPGTKHVIPAPSGPVPPLANKMYVPVVLGGSGSIGDGRFQHVMSTTGLSNGSRYYVAIKLEDGYNISWHYSEVPVLKQ